jgi:NTE family protein
LSARRRIGLVLGAGGPLGHAFHAGLLAAIEERLGWDPRRADVVVGTSAGAQVGALLRAGMCGRDLAARVMGDAMSDEGASIASHYVRPPYVAHTDYPRRFTPLSPRYLLRQLLRPWEARAGRLIAALLPPGRVCLRLQAEGLRRLFGEHWPANPLWITAVGMTHGELVAFGRDGSPRTDVGTAVTCSGAVPWVCAPVRVGDEHYVDGGVASATNLHLIEEANVDTVIVSSPLSRMPLMRWLLRREVTRLMKRGIEVFEFEPDRVVARAMGFNPMKLEKSAAVARAAKLQIAESLSPKSRIASRLHD